MRLGFYMGYAQPGTNPLELIELAREAERSGYDSAWAAEAWGTDAVTPLAWLGASTETLKLGTAIMQLPGQVAREHGDDRGDARPALGRALPARARHVGAAGRRGLARPGVGEAARRRRASTSRSCGRSLRRERLEHHGEHYDIPVTGGTGLGKPLKLMLRPLRAEIPIYLAAISPKAVELAFEIADGWLPIFWSPEQARDVFPLDARARGIRHRSDGAGGAHR